MSYYDDPDWYDDEDQRRLKVRQTLVANKPEMSDEDRMETENEIMRQLADGDRNSELNRIGNGITPDFLQVFNGGVAVDDEEGY